VKRRGADRVPPGSAAATLVRRPYKFDATQHATGAVTILGRRHDNATAGGGEAAALAFVEMLAQHPATAERIARKLCVFFSRAGFVENAASAPSQGCHAAFLRPFEGERP
jgi:hypothetical protein